MGTHVQEEHESDVQVLRDCVCMAYRPKRVAALARLEARITEPPDEGCDVAPITDWGTDTETALAAVRWALKGYQEPQALVALDSLAAAFEKIERERDKRIEDLNEACRQYVGELDERTRERDEALHAEDVAERYREALEVEKRNLRVEADTFMETAKFHAKKVKALEAALREIADGTRPFLGGTQNLSRAELVLKARRALGEE